MSEDLNQRAIYEFVSAHGGEHLGMDDYGNCNFRARIDYAAAESHYSGLTTVRIVRNGYDQGDVKLEQQEGLSPLEFHLDFKPRFGTFEYDHASKALVINSESAKMKGLYTVRIVV